MSAAISSMRKVLAREGGSSPFAFASRYAFTSPTVLKSLNSSLSMLTCNVCSTSMMISSIVKESIPKSSYILRESSLFLRISRWSGSRCRSMIPSTISSTLLASFSFRKERAASKVPGGHLLRRSLRSSSTEMSESELIYSGVYFTVVKNTSMGYQRI